MERTLKPIDDPNVLKIPNCAWCEDEGKEYPPLPDKAPAIYLDRICEDHAARMLSTYRLDHLNRPPCRYFVRTESDHPMGGKHFEPVCKMTDTLTPCLAQKALCPVPELYRPKTDWGPL